jgi:hypothetical protein
MPVPAISSKYCLFTTMGKAARIMLFFAPTVWKSAMPRPCRTISIVALLLTALGLAAAAQASTATESGRTQLLAAYRLLGPRLQQGTGGAPLTVQTSSRDGLLLGDAYAILDHPYGKVSEALRDGRNWCEILPLHLNVKACTSQTLGSGTRLTVYAGRKTYQPPGQARALHYTYRVLSLDGEYFNATLAADEAAANSPPMALEAVPLNATQTLMHARYASQTPLWLRIATDSYFATVGARKVGFSSTGTGQYGTPVYIGGLHGAVERNTLRYYLALETYLSTERAPETGRYDLRLNRWFDLTERNPEQLHEMSKADYLRAKRKERRQQLALQARLDAAPGP